MRRREFIWILFSSLILSKARAEDVNSELIAENFLESTRESAQNLGSVLLEYRFSSSHTFLGFDLHGYGRIELSKDKKGYTYTAQVRKLGGPVAYLGKLGLVNLPRIDTILEGTLVFANERFEPVVFKKRDLATDEPEKIMHFTNDEVWVEGTDHRLSRTNEYCPISMFLNYIFFHSCDTVENGAIMNFSKGLTATRTEVSTSRQETHFNDNTYTHIMHLSGPLLDMIEGDVEFSLLEKQARRLPTRGHAARLLSQNKAHEVYIRLEKADITYS
ncbi:MAG: hypothetical protein ABIJ21_04270 [Nanoarchaeota archaeon]